MNKEIKKAMLESRIAKLEGRTGRDNVRVVNKLKRQLRNFNA